MAIFPNVILESVVQVQDLTRLDASRSSVSAGETITAVEIQPDSGEDFIDVTAADMVLDWEYATAGTKTVTVRVTTDGDPVTLSKTLTVVTEADDKLFSTDADLVAIEPGVLGYLRNGRNSFKDVHRQAQTLILDWLDEQGIRSSSDDSRLGKDAFIATAQVRKWATYLVLQLIFEGLSNAVDDVFSVKAAKYESLAARASARVDLKLDRDGDGETDDEEPARLSSVGVFRR